MSLPLGPQIGARKISVYATLKAVSLPAAYTFALRYSKEYCYVAPAQAAIDYPTHALYPKLIKRWDSRREPFWWNCIARKDIDSHRTVRSWLSRRLRCAFTESLRKRGYDADGNRIDGIGLPLVGTAQLFPHKTLLVARYADVVFQTDLAVTSIIQLRNTYKPPNKQRGGQVQQEKRPLHGKRKNIKAPEVQETPQRYATERVIKF